MKINEQYLIFHIDEIENDSHDEKTGIYRHQLTKSMIPAKKLV